MSTLSISKISRHKKINNGRITLLLMALPFIVFIFMFCYVPLFGWSFAFFDYKPGVSLSKTPFVGLKYFKLIWENREDIFRVLRNTLAFGFLGLLFSPLPVITAIMMNEVRSVRFKKFVQTTTTVPNFVSWVIVFGLAYAFFSTEGLINQILSQFNPTSAPINVLGNDKIVWIFQTALAIWKSLGWSTIIYLAAISGIDDELYSAAKVDGAGRFRSILHVTVPGVMPTFIVLLLLTISNLLSVGFEQYFVFKNPMVSGSIEVLDLYVYRIGLVTNDYSFATAIGILKSIVSIIMLFTVNNIAKKVRGQSII